MRSRWISPLLATLALLIVVPQAFGHAVVYPKRSAPGAYEKYLLRVPNEKAVATTRIEIHFPAGLRVTAFGEVAGWQLEVQNDSAQRIIGAVWTGTLAPHRFVELPFVAANPKSDTTLVWPVFQTYEGGERVEWTGPEGSKSPASVTTIAAASDATSKGASAPSWVAWVALVVAIVSLGFAIRRPSSSASAA